LRQDSQVQYVPECGKLERQSNAGQDFSCQATFTHAPIGFALQ